MLHVREQGIAKAVTQSSLGPILDSCRVIISKSLSNAVVGIKDTQSLRCYVEWMSNYSVEYLKYIAFDELIGASTSGDDPSCAVFASAFGMRPTSRTA